MVLHPVISITAPVAVFLIIVTGFFVMVGATRLAGRLFLMALGILILPLLAFGILGNIHNEIGGGTKSTLAAGVLLAIALFGICIVIWFAIRLKVLHLLQNWLIPRFGREVDGQVTGAFVLRLVDAWWVSVKFFVTIGVLVLVIMFAVPR